MKDLLDELDRKIAAASPQHGPGRIVKLIREAAKRLRDGLRSTAAAQTPAPAAVPKSLCSEPCAWWAETGTAGAGLGCNRPFWLEHEAIAYVRHHGGYVAPLFRRWGGSADV